MKPILYALPLGLLLAATATSQIPDAPRGAQAISSDNVSTTQFGFGGFKVAAPKQSFPARPGNNLASTVKLVYAVFMDADQPGLLGVPELVIRRSIDGGYTWEPPVTIWRSQGDALAAEDTFIEAVGDEVWVSFTSTQLCDNPDGTGRTPNNVGGLQTWVAYSPDQGQTWKFSCATWNSVFPFTGTLGTPVQFSAIDDPTEVAVSVLDVTATSTTSAFHVIFNTRYADNGTGTSSSQEDNYYVGFTVGANAQPTRISPAPGALYFQPSTPEGTVDSDDPFIAADGSIVVLTSQDISAGGSNANGNDTYVRVSTDLGLTFPPSTNLTNLGGNGSSGDFQSECAVVDGSDVNNAVIVVTNQDATPSGGSADEPQTHVSFDSGQTWTSNGAIVRGSGVDVDDSFLFTDGAGISWIAFIDDRDGPGNVDNDVFVVVDNQNGMGWVNGTTFERRITDSLGNSDLDESEADALVINGGKANGGESVLAFALLGEFPDGDAANPEEAGYAISFDGGDNWDVYALLGDFTTLPPPFGGPDGDWDDGDVALTLNRDIVHCSNGEPAGRGNAANRNYVNGSKSVRLVDNMRARGGLQIVDTLPTVDANQIAIVFPSLLAPTSNGTPFGNTGVAYNFTADALTVAAAGSLPLFLVQADASGNFTPVLRGIGPISRLVQNDVYWIATVFDAQTGTPLGQYSDAVLQPR